MLSCGRRRHDPEDSDNCAQKLQICTKYYTQICMTPGPEAIGRLGAAMRARRKALGKQIADVARDADVHASQVSRILGGAVQHSKPQRRADLHGVRPRSRHRTGGGSPGRSGAGCVSSTSAAAAAARSVGSHAGRRRPPVAVPGPARRVTANGFWEALMSPTECHNGPGQDRTGVDRRTNDGQADES